MTIAELREVLQALPPKWDQCEVVTRDGVGMRHIAILDLQLRAYPASFNPEISHDRKRRKLRLLTSTFGGKGTLWYEDPPPFRLVGPWPEELAELGGVEAMA